MRKILCLIPDLNHGGAARQLTLLARGLPRDRFEVRLCVLGRDGPAGPPLRRAGVEPVCLGGARRLLDPRPLWRLRDLVRSFRPEVIHAWKLPSLRAIVAAGRKRDGASAFRLLVSVPRPGRGRAPGRLDRWLLRRAEAVIAEGPAQAAFCRRLDVPEERIRVVPAGVERAALDGRRAAADSVLGRLNLPAHARLLACAGPLERHKGIHNAIWAFDIVRFVHPDLHLLVIGGGPERQRLERFARSMPAGDRVHFVGEQPDGPALLARSEVVLAPGESEGGVNVALEGMAAGRPVVASRLPGLAEVVLDGETGLLAPPGDKAALARQAGRLLEDAALARRLGEAGRCRAEGSFAAEDLVARFAALYEEAGQA